MSSEGLLTGKRLCDALGLDAKVTRTVKIEVRPQELPTVEVQQIAMDRSEVWRGFKLVSIETWRDLRALAVRYASECAECGGSGEIRVTIAERHGHALLNPIDSVTPCPACADIRAVLAKVEGS